jgi:hypothetical protein
VALKQGSGTLLQYAAVRVRNNLRHVQRINVTEGLLATPDKASRRV